MFALGVVMMIVACVMTYIYFTKVKNGGGSQSLEGRNQLAAQKAASLRAELESKELEIQNIKPGGVLRLEGVGLELLDFDLQISARHIVKKDSNRIIELEATSGSDKVYLSIEDDNVYVTLKSPELNELGLKKSDLDGINGDDELSITYQGETFELDGLGVGTYCKDGNELEGESFEEWSFAAEESDHYLGIWRWGDHTCEVSFSVLVAKSQITVYSLS